MRRALLAISWVCLIATAQAQDLSGYKLTFDDEFNALNAGLPGSKGITWETSNFYGNLSTGNSGTVNPAPPGQPGSLLSVTNGVLTMGVTQRSSPYLDTNPNGVPGGFSQEHGYFQARMMTTPGDSFWNAFWLLPNQGGWPPEIDIMEASNNMAEFTNHGGDINTPVQSTSIYDRPDLSTGFHTYGLLWTPTTLTWYLDGQAILSAPTAANENVPMNIILSAYDKGGPLSGMYVDYVFACSNNGANPEITAQPGYTGGCASLGAAAPGASNMASTSPALAPSLPASMTAPPIDTSRLLYNPARDDPPPLPPVPSRPEAAPRAPPCAFDRAYRSSIVVAHGCGEAETSQPIVWDRGADFRGPIATDYEPFEAVISAGGG